MDRDELQHAMAALRGHVPAKERLPTADKVETQFAAYLDVLEPLCKEPDRARLRAIALNLKAQGGKYWEIGETVERACILFDALEQKGKAAE